jgi:putative hydrolase of the HAD superfamily
MRPPEVIFLDAVGTLFGVRGSVGEIYGSIASRYGVDVAADRLDRAFIDSFRISPPLAFAPDDPERVAGLEFRWWYSIARSTFENAGYLDRFTDFDGFFAQLYDYFATAEPWFIYDDVIPALNRWRERGISLGIISNFDSRIFSVLKSLEIESYFQSITISSMSGAAKPDPRIFQIALQKHDCPAESAWHIGDSRKEDYEGARAIGLRAFLLER